MENELINKLNNASREYDAQLEKMLRDMRKITEDARASINSTYTALVASLYPHSNM